MKVRALEISCLISILNCLKSNCEIRLQTRVMRLKVTKVPRIRDVIIALCGGFFPIPILGGCQ